MMNPSESPTFSYAADLFEGSSASVARLRLQAERIAPHFRIALVTGEPGSGKKRLGLELHRLGAAAETPFTYISAADFADATPGIAEEQLAGTLYLHGIERLTLGQQEQLVGSINTSRFPGRRATDPRGAVERVILGSNRDLRGLVAAGRMRLEFQSKVGTLELRVPSLRERIEDLEILVAGMLNRMEARCTLGESALRALRAHGWPGNLRELGDLLAKLGDREGVIEACDLPPFAIVEEEDQPIRLDDVMQRHVVEVLQRCAGNKVRAAEMLGISRSTLYRMLESIAA